MSETQRTIPIRLYGDMGKRFGKQHRLAVSTPGEAIRALCVIKPGFAAYLRERFDQPFRVIRGEEALDEDGLLAPVGRAEVIKIVPVVAGAKDGFGQILLGAALIGLAFYTAGGSSAFSDVLYSYIGSSWMQSAGIALVLGGVAGMLATTPKMNNAGLDSGGNAETFSFNNPTLTTGQGGAVPVLYGTMRIGGHIISAGIDAQQWTVGGFDKAICTTDDGTGYGNGDSVPWMWARDEADHP